LAGFTRMAPSELTYPFIVVDPGARVDGVLIMDLTPCDMQLLDRYEEIEAGMYRRELVEVEAWGCGPQPMLVQAYTYVAGPALIESTAG